MECKISGGKLVTGQTVYEGMTEQPIDVDYSLPDYCPDIGKVLRCSVVPYINSRQVSGESIRIEGSARISVIYLDEREHGTSCCVHDVPFTTMVKTGGELPAESWVEVSAREDYFNCRAASPRRISVHGTFTLAIKAIAATAHDYIENAQGEGIRAKQISVKASSFVGCSQQSFVLSQDLELPESKPAASCIINTSCQVIGTESKAIANKLIVKGECLLRIIYRAENSRELECMDYTVPFSQFVDLTGVDDECRCVVRLEPGVADIGVRPDADGEYRRFAAEIGIFVDCRAYRPKELCAVCDAYSTEYELNTVRRQMSLDYLSDIVTERVTASVGIDLGELAAARVDGVWASAVNTAAAVRDGKLRIVGKATAYAIAADAQEVTGCFEGSREFDCEVPVEASCAQCECDARFCVRSVSYRLSGANRIEVTLEIDVTAAVKEKPMLGCIVSLSVDKSLPRQQCGCSALTLYFAEAGEELWDIARCCNSSVETIMSENGLEQETVAEPCRLLISM